MSQAPGLSGTPDRGQVSSAATSASCASSSARPTSRTIRARPAMSLADSILQTASMARCAAFMRRFLLLHLGPQFLVAIQRFAGSEVLELEELPNLDLAVLAADGGIGEAPGPFHRFFARLHLDEGVAGDELLRLGEGAVDDRALASGVLDAPALLARLQPRAVEQHPGLLQLLVVLRHLGQQLLLGHDARFRILRRFHYDHESHD